ncbi:MAG: S8 family serine peptidase, partial [Anaerolineae bacterium]
MDPSKLHPSLAAAVTSKSFDQPTVPVIVQRSPGPVAHGDVGVMSELEPFHEFVLLPASAVNVEPAMIAALTQDPSVVMIWPDLPVHTWLDDAVPIVRAPRVWETSFTGRGVRIAVLDTGIDPGHPDFEGRIVAYRDFLTQGTGASTATEPAPEVGAASAGAAGAAGLAGTTGPAGSTGPAGTTGPVGAVGRASEMTDPNGHGTHVAGIAAGSGAGSDGLYRGVAPEADLVIARVLDASGNGRTSDVMAGLEWALGQSAQVVNVSLGGPPYPGDGTDAFSLLVNAAVDAGA